MCKSVDICCETPGPSRAVQSDVFLVENEWKRQIKIVFTINLKSEMFATVHFTKLRVLAPLV
jgi:hypothetical protein